MLKIKNEVDLKELEKFGFTKKEMYWMKEKGYVYYINENTRIIKICVDEYGEYILNDTLYDLIQAGLVEKVQADRMSEEEAIKHFKEQVK